MGIGFAKTGERNLQLLQRLRAFGQEAAEPGVPSPGCAEPVRPSPAAVKRLTAARLR